MTDKIDDLGIDRTHRRIQPSGMTFADALAIATRVINPMTDRERDITEMHKAGRSVEYIARAMKLPPKSVRGSLELYGLIEGITVPPPGFWNTDEGVALDAKIEEMDTNGFPAREIAARHKLPAVTVQRRLAATRRRRAKLDRRRDLRQQQQSDAA